jgi:hypothetical protein
MWIDQVIDELTGYDVPMLKSRGFYSVTYNGGGASMQGNVETIEDMTKEIFASLKIKRLVDAEDKVIALAEMGDYCGMKVSIGICLPVGHEWLDGITVAVN